jgi:hypothetical protein
MPITRTDRQSIFDVALQYCGDAQAAFEIVDMNNLSLTDTETLTLEVPITYNKRMVEYYHNNDIKPATVDNENEVVKEMRFFEAEFDNNFE